MRRSRKLFCTDREISPFIPTFIKLGRKFMLDESQIALVIHSVDEMEHVLDDFCRASDVPAC
jgi:hypothetical protein